MHLSPHSNITQLGANGSTADQVSYDPFSMQTMNQAMPTGAYNPYLEDTNMPTNAASYFQAQSAFAAPAQPVSSSHPQLSSVILTS